MTVKKGRELEVAVADIAFGGTGREANLYRYAYDHGINYFDTAEGYANGDNERLIGEALQHMDRKKVFVTTKLWNRDHGRERGDDEAMESVAERPRERAGQRDHSAEQRRGRDREQRDQRLARGQRAIAHQCHQRREDRERVE